MSAEGAETTSSDRTVEKLERIFDERCIRYMLLSRAGWPRVLRRHAAALTGPTWPWTTCAGHSGPLEGGCRGQSH